VGEVNGGVGHNVQCKLMKKGRHLVASRIVDHTAPNLRGVLCFVVLACSHIRPSLSALQQEALMQQAEEVQQGDQEASFNDVVALNKVGGWA